MSFFRAALTVGSLTLISRVLGLVRDIVVAQFIGAGPIADAFFVALKLPNMFRRITAEGAFSVSFVPIYSKLNASQNAAASHRFVVQAATWMLLILGVLTTLSLVFIPSLVSLIAPGFEGERLTMTIEMSRVTFPYLMLVSFVALMGGMLNAHHRFAPQAVSPVLFNLALISSVFLQYHLNFSNSYGHALAYGVLLAGVLQALYLRLALWRARLRIGLSKPFLTPEIRKLGRLMMPGLIGASAIQVNILIDIILASLLPAGAVSYLYYADRLYQLPLGLIGVAIGTALLPKLSAAIQTQTSSPSGKNQAQRLWQNALLLGTALVFPAMAGLLLLPEMITQVLFEHGQFTSKDSIMTRYAIQAYALGLPAMVNMKILSTTLYAHENTRTPMVWSLIGTTINIISSIILMPLLQHYYQLGHVGLALATSLSSWIQFLGLGFFLKRHHDYTLAQIFPQIAKVFLSTLIMGGMIFAFKVNLPSFGFSSTPVSEILTLLGIVFVSLVLYGLLLCVTKTITPRQLFPR